MAFAFGPMAFFVVGILKNVTRPFDDLEAKKMVKIFEITQALKVVLSGVFVCWGLWVFSFRENSEYFDDYKDKIVSGLSVIQLCNVFSTMASKYFYTTIVGVDYMLNQILYARKHEVLMQMHKKSDMWGQSTHAKLAAKIHKDYVRLLNVFCKIQDKAENTEKAWEEWQEEATRSNIGRARSRGESGAAVDGLGVEMTTRERNESGAFEGVNPMLKKAKGGEEGRTKGFTRAKLKAVAKFVKSGGLGSEKRKKSRGGEEEEEKDSGGEDSSEEEEDSSEEEEESSEEEGEGKGGKAKPPPMTPPPGAGGRV